MVPGADDIPESRPGQERAAELRPEAASASRPKTPAEIEHEAEEHFSKVDWWLQDIEDKAVAAAVARMRDEFCSKFSGDDPKSLMCRSCKKYFPFPYAFSIYYLMVWTGRMTAEQLAYCKACREKKGMKSFEEEMPGQGPFRFEPIVAVVSVVSSFSSPGIVEEREEESDSAEGNGKDDEDDDEDDEDEEDGDDQEESDEDEDEDDEDDDDEDDQDELVEAIARALTERGSSEVEESDSDEDEIEEDDDSSSGWSNKCEDCDGEWLGFGNGKCSHCHGQGYEPYSLLPGGISDPCRECGRSGVCQTCGGEGSVD